MKTVDIECSVDAYGSDNLRCGSLTLRNVRDDDDVRVSLADAEVRVNGWELLDALRRVMGDVGG